MTGCTFYRSIVASLLSLTLIGCGGGSGSSEQPSQSEPTQPTMQTYTVTVIDGYLKGATVWLDLNDNGLLDANEPSTESKSNGIANLSISSDISTSSYSVLAIAEAGKTFDESLNSTVNNDFVLASVKGGKIITPLTTLVYVKERELNNSSVALAEVTSAIDTSNHDLFEDFIATENDYLAEIAADLVRLLLMPSTPEQLKGMSTSPNSLMDSLVQYTEIRNRGVNGTYVMLDSSGELAGDTDLDGVADTDDNDIDGDGIINEEDNAPYDAQPNTKLKPGILSLDQQLSESVAINEWHYFKLEVSDFGMLNVNLSNLTGDIDLYISESTFPTKFEYLCRSNESDTIEENCSIRNEQENTYYLGLLARNNASFKLSATIQEIVNQKAMLLLHGLASSPSTWDAMVNDDSFFNGECYTLTVDNESLPSYEENVGGISCYNLEFGSLDRGSIYSAVGLENKVCNSVLGCNGDYTTFEGLGVEVESAISRIVEHLGQDVEVFLFGHSRGGLAARSFIQNQSLEYKSLVKGLATTGTPHQGSPLGRFYQYMDDNCTPKSAYRQDGSVCEDSWEVVEMLNGTRIFLGYKYQPEYRMEMQAPSIDFLSPESSQLNELNEYIYHLDGFVLGQLAYEGTTFGFLSRGAGLSGEDIYDLYDYGRWFGGDHPHPDTLRYIENGVSRESLIGDGIVPADSQKLSLLLVQQGISVNKAGTQDKENVLHTEETSQVSDIHWLFESLYQSLEWK
ncbi:peptidase [Shewanella olleyana]|uniref:pre-peptidase C-terminal domain-containing protein n=1 Tax=Shewanella olleyana TaxID=135626 RepID=UPI00200FB7B5|nr:pre-peptidase C-terminal domain-containing protein [Shewanella olleyana]MCL1068626.1 peptidase [Shewanella olleyana]